jgi:hypothetical protein
MKLKSFYLFHWTQFMNVFFLGWYKSHPNILQLLRSVLKCRIMSPEVKILRNGQDRLLSLGELNFKFTQYHMIA